MKKIKKWYFTIPPIIIIAFIFALDNIIGLTYEKITPKYGRQNLNLALSEYNGVFMKLRKMPHPYMTEINTPYWEENGIIQHNNLGYRDTTDINISKDSNCVRILVLGGSTTYGKVDKSEETYPKQLEKILNDSIKNLNCNYFIQVINGGMYGATSAELLDHYIFQDRYLSPDIVIIHTCINDIQPACFKDYSPDYSNWRTIKSEGRNGLKKGEGWLINHSNLVKLFYTIWYSKIDYATSRAFISTKDYREVEINELRKNISKNDNLGFYRNLDLLLRNITCDKYYPILFQEDIADINNPAFFTKVLNKKDKERYEIMGIQLMKNIKTARQICKKYNVEFLSMEKGSILPENMLDICHLTKEGEFQKAEFLSKNTLPIIKDLIKTKLIKKE